MVGAQKYLTQTLPSNVILALYVRDDYAINRIRCFKPLRRTHFTGRLINPYMHVIIVVNEWERLDGHSIGTN